jgi:hypothetical protein
VTSVDPGLFISTKFFIALPFPENHTIKAVSRMHAR